MTLEVLGSAGPCRVGSTNREHADVNIECSAWAAVWRDLTRSGRIIGRASCPGSAASILPLVDQQARARRD